MTDIFAGYICRCRIHIHRENIDYPYSQSSKQLPHLIIFLRARAAQSVSDAISQGEFWAGINVEKVVLYQT